MTNRHQRRAARKLGSATKAHSFALGEKVEFTDFTTAPDQLEKLIDDKRLIGCLTLYKLFNETPGKIQLGMMNGGFTIEDCFDLICTIRRSMMETMNFIDMTDPSMMEKVQANAVKRQDAALGCREAGHTWMPAKEDRHWHCERCGADGIEEPLPGVGTKIVEVAANEP